jgi:hypothetical protein
MYKKSCGIFVEYPSEEVQIDLIINDYKIIQYMDNPSETVQLIAVNQCGEMIFFIDNPSENVQLAAMNRNKNSYKYMKYPCQRAKRLITFL